MIKTIRRCAAILALLVLPGLAAAQIARVQANITTQNLVAGGACTTGGCVEIEVANKGVVTVQVTGTYTGALSGQITTDGATWVTLAPTPFAPFTAISTPTATIGSGTTGVWQVSAVAGALKFRVTALAAVTGTATITLQSSPASIGSSGGGGGGGAITAAANALAAGSGVDGWDLTQGAKADAAAAADTSTASLIALMKRALQNLTTLNTSVNTTDTVASATLANVAASATNVTCLASNASRKRAVIFNDSVSATLYVKPGATSSTSSFTWQVPPGGTLTLESFPVYTGILDCIWSAASGNARVTEF